MINICFDSRENALTLRDVTIGDSSLLLQFLHRISLHSTGKLFFTAPYYDEFFLTNLSRSLLQSQIELEILVKGRSDADRVFNILNVGGWQYLSLSIAKHLHAKAYIFESKRGDLETLIGSQNATHAGTTKNLEASVYFAASKYTAEWESIFRFREFLRSSSKHYDSKTNNGGVRV